MGQLCHGDRQGQLVPKRIEALQGVRVSSVAAGSRHSLAVCAVGGVWSWGNGINGKLGHGNKEDQLVPKQIEALQGVRVSGVAAGFGHSLAVSSRGTFYGWGFGHDCTLGLQLTEDQMEPMAHTEMQARAAAMV